MSHASEGLVGGDPGLSQPLYVLVQSCTPSRNKTSSLTCLDRAAAAFDCCKLPVDIFRPLVGRMKDVSRMLVQAEKSAKERGEDLPGRLLGPDCTCTVLHSCISPPSSEKSSIPHHTSLLHSGLKRVSSIHTVTYSSLTPFLLIS